MAKKTPTKSAEGRSKQAIIIEVLKANPDMSSADAVEKIKSEYGVEINTNYYQVTKSNYTRGKINEEGKFIGGQGQPKKTGTRKTSTRKTGTPVNGSFDLGVLSAAKSFSDEYETYDEARAVLERVREMGGVESALEAVNALETLQS